MSTIDVAACARADPLSLFFSRPFSGFCTTTTTTFTPFDFPDGACARAFPLVALPPFACALSRRAARFPFRFSSPPRASILSDERSTTKPRPPPWGQGAVCNNSDDFSPTCRRRGRVSAASGNAGRPQQQPVGRPPRPKKTRLCFWPPVLLTSKPPRSTTTAPSAIAATANTQTHARTRAPPARTHAERARQVFFFFSAADADVTPRRSSSSSGSSKPWRPPPPSRPRTRAT